MAREELEIEIDAQGHVTVHTKGYKGKSCLKIAEELVQILGREESRQLTSEYYEAEESQTAQSQVDVHQRR